MPDVTDAASQARDGALDTALGALEEIYNREDCTCSPSERGVGQYTCSRCVARDAIERAKDWRFIGSRPDRQLTNPCERTMAYAWRQFTDDFKLSQILDEEGKTPTPRDWYVASSVIQWLGTNVGGGLLYEGGYRYDEDLVKRTVDKILAAEETAKAERRARKR